MRAQWQRLRAEQEQRELDGCTFAPRLSARAPLGAYTPLPQRVRELQRLKRRAPRLRLGRETSSCMVHWRQQPLRVPCV